MDIEEEAIRLKIYMGEADHYGKLLAYKAVVHFLKEKGIWGATVTKGIYGFGKRSILHSSTPLRLSEDMPVIVDAVDSREKILPLVPALSEMVRGGLITTEEIKVLGHIG